MTTRVIIKSPDPNHQNLKITAQQTNANGEWVDAEHIAPLILTDGQEASHLYIYCPPSGQRLVIEEIAKEVKE